MEKYMGNERTVSNKLVSIICILFSFFINKLFIYKMFGLFCLNSFLQFFRLIMVSFAIFFLNINPVYFYSIMIIFNVIYLHFYNIDCICLCVICAKKRLKYLNIRTVRFAESIFFYYCTISSERRQLF